MTTEIRQNIVAAAFAYMKAKKLSQADMSRLSRINPAYLSIMLKGETTSGTTTIEKRWFVQLAKACEYEYEKSYWCTVQTPQFMQVINALQESKKNSSTAIIIDDTGFGKTYAVDRFCNKNPLHTYRITVSAQHKMIDIVNELLDIMNLETIHPGSYYNYSKVARLGKIISKLTDLKLEGHEPIIILDEAENLSLPVLQMLKALYDGVKNSSAIVLIGTEQLLIKLHKLKSANKEGMPQFYRRFKAGIVQVIGGKSFEVFFDKFVQDKGLRRLLNDICDNYGELNDYLEPALREADQRGVPLTEDFFRIKYNLPKLRTA